MNKNNKFSIIAFTAIAVIGLSAYTFTIEQGYANTNSDNEIAGIRIHNSYTTIDLQEMKKISENIVKGTIVDKYQIIQYRDIDGNYVTEDSGKVAQKEPYIVYELLTTDVMKGKYNENQIITFKTFGGSFNSIQVSSDVPEFEVGEKTIVLLEPALDGEHYEITSGEYGIFKISNQMASNANKNISETELISSLR